MLNATIMATTTIMARSKIGSIVVLLKKITSIPPISANDVPTNVHENHKN